MSALAFELSAALEASQPPEVRGLSRDGVRLMVAYRAEQRLVHASFRDLPDHIGPGDLLVINTSATLPAAVPARRRDGTSIEVRFSTRAPRAHYRDLFVVELRDATGEPIERRGRTGEQIHLPGALDLQLLAPYAAPGRLWVAQLDVLDLPQYLLTHGHPIRYGYVPGQWPLSAYQTVYSTGPGSAEMPSAGRPFTAELITKLVAGGTLIAPVALHCGVSSPERDEPPYAEEYTVPETTARLVNSVRAWGGRVVAVGTTVVRALESAVAPDGAAQAGAGWTELVISPERPPQLIDGLITGWHEPGASHLQILDALAGPALVELSYEAALASGYLWHEFGDSHLILP
ncbi:MAG TPA: S-adenosylmethionine:tRNA ribosyltransferase-isomerase [Solirubrobacteraceae bacterium]|jgi:S-adenosylmethionine:tRNA ribosyltransferase-isomerase|nr:S-adenosylmethionine:tRNA ribosyltransferase-isomerase [Solirubrobacteraceae bacterium]